MHGTLIAGGVLALAAAALYVGLAVVSLRRRVRPEYATAWRLFGAWWISVGANLALTGLVTLAAASGVRDLAFYVTHGHLERLVLAAGLWALLAHVGFLITGDRRTWVPLGLYYAAYYVLTLFRLAASRPSGVALNEFARPALIPTFPAPPAWELFMLALLLVPPITASMLYFRLYFRTRDRERRLRIAVTSWGVATWFLLSVGAYFMSGSLVLQVANRGLGVLIAAAILYVSLARRDDANGERPADAAQAKDAPAPAEVR